MAAEQLKIGFVFDDSIDSSDGVSQYVRTVGAWLTSHNHDVSYLVGESVMQQWEGGPVFSMSKNIRVRFNANRLSIPLLARKKRIRNVLSLTDLDILHVQMPFSPLMAQRVISQAAPKTAVVGTFHILPAGRLQSAGSKLLGFVLRKSLRRFDGFMSVSPAAADFAWKNFGIQSDVLPNAVHLQHFRRAPRTNTYPKTSKKRVVFLGRLVERKGARQLIEAFAGLPAQILQDTELLIAGDGPLRHTLQKLVTRCNITENVRFLGFIEEADKPQLLSSADIACFPSLYGESFGIVLIEAMAAGAQVVLGGNNPGYSSVLGDQPLLLVNPKDTTGFTDRLKMLLTDKKEYTRLHTWQTEYVQQFGVDRVGNKILQFYRTALAKRHANSHTK